MPENNYTSLESITSEEKKVVRETLSTVKAKADRKRTPTEKFADWMSGVFGSMAFLITNAVVFAIWILINTGHAGSIPAFDPFPFSLLTTIVSLEAIILAIFVLISQNRTLKVDDLREEVHLQINLIAEKEITKLMKMTAILLQKNGVDVSHDPELKKYLKPINEMEIEKRLEKEIVN